MERNVEEAIARAKTVYEWVTGEPAPEASAEAPYARIPPEVDREEHVLRQAVSLFEKVRGLGLSDRSRSGAFGHHGGAGSERGVLPTLPAPVMALQGEKEIRYVFELPGVTKERVSVGLRGRELSVSGERGGLSNDRCDDLVGSELLRARSERVVYLPIAVDAASVSAHFADGLLTVRVRMPPMSEHFKNIEVR